MTNEEIRTFVCFKCGKPAKHQWKICAYSQKFLCICLDCDIHLNTIIADFFNLDPKFVKKYEEKMRKLHADFDSRSE